LTGGDKAFVGKGRVTAEEAEMKGLRKELEKVKEERDILKKPWPYSPNETDEGSVYRRAQGDLQDKKYV
jgi:transposase-like protein